MDDIGVGDSGVFIKQEKTDETESNIPMTDIKQEASSLFYCGGLIHVKQEGEVVITDNGMSGIGVVIKEEKTDDTEFVFPTVGIKQVKGSLFYCGGLIPEQAEDTFVPDGGGLSHIKEEEEMIIPDDGDQNSLEKLQEINQCDLKTKINVDSKSISNASLVCGRKAIKLRKHQCPRCKYRAVYPSKLKIHVIACHTGEKPHHCPSCDYRATTNSILKRHIKASHMSESKSHKCPHCDFTAADIVSLERHISAHNTGKEHHKIDHSDETTIQSNDVELAQHKEENPLQCPHCEYKAVYPSKLKMHVMACHTGEKPHQCPDCDYKSVKISNLKIHILAHHTDEKPYPCPHCDYKAVTHSTLKTHIRYRHTGEKPHQCPHCDYKSVTVSCLKKHIMARHLGEKPHQCPHCDYRATQRSNLRTHIKYIHMYLGE